MVCIGSCLWLLTVGFSFTEVGASAGIGPYEASFGSAWVDYDCDDDVDLLAAANDAPQMLFRNNGDGTFSNVQPASGITIGQGEIGPSFGDYDNDGDADIYFHSSDPSASRLYRNEGDGTFTDVTASSSTNFAGRATAVAWTDFNRDEWLDLFVWGTVGPPSLFRNNGNGTFTDVAESAGLAFGGSNDDHNGWAFGDYNGDSYPDLVVSTRITAPRWTRLYRNNGNGTFTDVSAAMGIDTTRGALGVQWVDYDNDGDVDLFLHGFDYSLLYRNDGTSFSEVAHAVGLTRTLAAASTIWQDFDNDGDMDIWYGGHGPPSAIYRNDGGTFSDATAGSGLGEFTGFHAGSAADYDQDGDIDFYSASDEAARLCLFRNNQSGNNWFQVQLVGQPSPPYSVPRDATNSRLELFFGGGRLVQQVDGGHEGHQAEQHSPVLHYGLSSVSSIDSRVVRWTDGSRFVLSGGGVEVNRRYFLHYPSVLDRLSPCHPTVAVPQPQPVEQVGRASLRASSGRRSLSLHFQGISQIGVYSIDGRLVRTLSVNPGALPGASISIPLPPGVYGVVGKTGTGRSLERKAVVLP